MWDLTVPGNDDHDFYVVPAPSDGGHETYHVEAEGASILAHNAGGLCPTNGLPRGRMGESATHEAHQKAGYSNITREPQFINSNGDPFRADFVAQNPSGDWGRSTRRQAQDPKYRRIRRLDTLSCKVPGLF
jgi:hypothetical protein